MGGSNRVYHIFQTLRIVLENLCSNHTIFDSDVGYKEPFNSSSWAHTLRAFENMGVPPYLMTYTMRYISLMNSCVFVFTKQFFIQESYIQIFTILRNIPFWCPWSFLKLSLIYSINQSLHHIY